MTTTAQDQELLMCPFTGREPHGCPLDDPGIKVSHLAWHTRNHVLADLARLREELQQARLMVDGQPGVRVHRGEELRAAVLAVCAELRSSVPEIRGEIRTRPMLDADGRGIGTVYGIGLPNGSGLVWRVTARVNPGTQEIGVRAEGPWTDNNDAFWEARLTSPEPAQLTIGGVLYSIRPDDEPGMRGNGGQVHHIRALMTGQVITTRNLDYLGIIPPAWRDRFPDTAEFTGQEPPDDPERGRYISEAVTAAINLILIDNGIDVSRPEVQDTISSHLMAMSENILLRDLDAELGPEPGEWT